MENYNNELINDYINCEIDDSSLVERLENNPQFMMSVISSTNDKRIYNLCSDKVKVDEKFVLFLVNKYKDDSAFIDSVGEVYLNSLNGEDETLRRASFANTMVKLLGHSSRAEKYLVVLNTVYSLTRVNVELLKKEDSKNNIEYGFSYFKSIYGNDDSLLSYFASRMVTEILDETIKEYEKFLHDSYELYEYVPDKYGFLLDHIDKYDKSLVDYLNDHMEALDKGSESAIKRIKSNWSKHELNVERAKYNKALDIIHEIVISNMDAEFAEEVLLVHLGYKYGIIDKIGKYAVMGDSFMQLLHDEYPDRYFKGIMDFSSVDRDLYHQVEKVLKKVLD